MTRQIPADYYSLEKPWNLYRYQNLCMDFQKTLRENGFYPLENKTILEIGCGMGNWLVDLGKWGAKRQNLSGIDLDQGRIEKAKSRLTGADLRHGNAACLPWAPESFDLVFQFTVFTSVSDGELKKKIAMEMSRSVKSGGLIIWYDFFVNNPWNSYVKGVSKKEIARLFPDAKVVFKKITLAPPLTRMLAPISKRICGFLENLSIFNTHYLAVIQKP